MKGDLIILATGREPHTKYELLPSEAEGKRRMDKDDTARYWLVDPDSHRIRYKGTLTTLILSNAICEEVGIGMCPPPLAESLRGDGAES